jgi:hypothetical protein
MQPLGCATEVQLLGDGDEIPQVPKFEITIHMPNIIIEVNKILDVMELSGQTSE